MSSYVPVLVARNSYQERLYDGREEDWHNSSTAGGCSVDPESGLVVPIRRRVSILACSSNQMAIFGLSTGSVCEIFN